MWEIQPIAEYALRRRTWEKKQWRELEAAEINLQTYLMALSIGTKPLQINYGFVHREPNGIVAIDQRGHGKSLKQTRLYAYPDTDESVLYVLTIGDKITQRKDIQFCKEFVASLRKQAEQSHDGEDEEPPENDEEIS